MRGNGKVNVNREGGMHTCVRSFILYICYFSTEGL